MRNSDWGPSPVSFMREALCIVHIRIVEMALEEMALECHFDKSRSPLWFEPEVFNLPAQEYFKWLAAEVLFQAGSQYEKGLLSLPSATNREVVALVVDVGLKTLREKRLDAGKRATYKKACNMETAGARTDEESNQIRLGGVLLSRALEEMNEEHEE